MKDDKPHVIFTPDNEPYLGRQSLSNSTTSFARVWS